MKYFYIAILAALMANIFHPYLWGPDEPREAEIAREIFVSGNYVTPQFCSQPFLEKPPLYYDTIAALFHITGANPGTARLVSAFFAVMMMCITILFTFKFTSARAGAIAAALLLAMPQFYRAGHWILLDIAIGAFCTGAFTAFAFYAFGKLTPKGKHTALALFYLATAGAFLTKGVIGVFYIALVCGAYIILRRKWNLIREFVISWHILIFILPCAAWLMLFYRDGGHFYIYEHFVNNTIGRLIHVNLTLPDAPQIMTDVGNASPFLFYFERMPAMFGLASAFVPILIYQALRFFKVIRFDATGKKALLFIEPDENNADMYSFILIWFFLPVCALSFSSIKEVTYILPSYPPLALLAANWIDARLPKKTLTRAGAICFAGAVTVSCIIAESLSGGFALYTALTGVIILGATAFAVYESFARKRPETGVFLVLACLAVTVIYANTPSVMRRTRLNRKCHIELADEVWRTVGKRSLFIFMTDETLRGSIPFYGNRNVSAFRDENRIKEVLASNGNALLMTQRRFEKLSLNTEFQTLFANAKIVKPDFPHLADSFVILLKQ